MLLHLAIYSMPSIYSVYHRNPLTYIVIYCKIRMFLVHVTNLTYRWAYTAASFDRYAMSSSNARLRRLATVPTAIRVLIGIFLFWVIFSAYIIALFDIQSNVCSIFNNATATLFTAFSSIILGVITPSTIMIVCSLLIRKNLKEKRERRQIIIVQRNVPIANEHLERKRDQQAFKLLFAQIIVYTVVTIPWVSFTINNLVSLYTPTKSQDRILIEAFVTAMSSAFSYIFPAMSFYICTLTSKMFRDELITMLKSIFKRNRIDPISTN